VTTTTTEHPVSLTRVFAWSVLAMLVFSFVVGAAVLPLRPTDGQFSSWWDGICRAVGVPLDVRTQAQPTSSPVVNAFVWSAEMERRVRRANLQNGGGVFESCSACHNSENRASDPNVPNIAGMSARVMLKQLSDYATGIRGTLLMQPVAQGLTEQDAIDLAAFITTLPRQDLPASMNTTSSTDPGNPSYRLSYFGDPRRGIAPCASCHGPDAVVPDAPRIDGLSSEYAQKQLDDFAIGKRSNDLYSPMRMISAQLTVDERAELARYFAGPRDR
jgi:cytochrome c553